MSIDPTDSFTIATAPSRKSAHWKQGLVTWADIIGWLDDPADTKEAGNYVFGSLTPTTVDHPKGKKGCYGLHRRKGAIAERSILSLDVDSPAGDSETFPSSVEELVPAAAIVHTTYSSTPDEPRYRVLIPLDRSVAADEYFELATVVMGWLDPDGEQFDPGSTQAERYMFKPAESQPGYFQSWVYDGDLLDVDSALAQFDPALLPTVKPRKHQNKRDPFSLDGTIGAFNRVYADFDELIDAYDLPYDVDTPGARWKLRGASAEAGLVLVTPGLVYSHHMHDPAYDKTCSAFDLVRVHRFYELDEECSPQTPVNRLPSHRAMIELAAEDKRVVADILGGAASDFDTVDDDDDLIGDLGSTDDSDGVSLDQSWRLGLTISAASGKMKDTLDNWDLITRHYQPFPSLYFNEFSMAVESSADYPWRSLDKGAIFTKIDLAQLCLMIERDFKIRPSRTFIDELVQATAQARFLHPVRQYLDGLKWDGKPRLETCLPGTDDNSYNRLVARKSLVAAVARAYDPGCKWDHTTVLYGTEGLGKTYWIDTMAKGWSAELGRIGDKDTLITMQRSWIMVADEGHSLKKADHDVQKSFLTRTEDVFRMPYDREAQVHKRHCVIWGSTNDEVFLRRQEGNRRFLIVRCERKADFTKYTEEYVDQVWAEAVALYRAGEPLFLSPEQTVEAADAREAYTEEDALAGIVQEYVDTLVPDNWDEMGSFSRHQWLNDRADGLVTKGITQMDEVCSLQVWAEAFGKRVGDHRRVDLLEITNVLKALPGWEKVPGRKRLPLYGPQMVFRRVPTAVQADSDLGDGWDLL
jgi:hypothetical protein